jgi:acyl-CoA thioesterase
VAFYERPALRVRAWRMRTASLELPPPVGAPAPAPALPADPSSDDGLPGSGYLRAVEWRFVTGHLTESGPAQVWTRLRVPVVAGEEPTGTQRLLTVADSGNGLSSVLSWTDWWFINTDLTVHLHRVPTGEWIYLDARSTLDPSGVGLAETELSDAGGRVGRGAQSLMVGPRNL